MDSTGTDAGITCILMATGEMVAASRSTTHCTRWLGRVLSSSSCRCHTMCFRSAQREPLVSRQSGQRNEGFVSMLPKTYNYARQADRKKRNSNMSRFVCFQQLQSYIQRLGGILGCYQFWYRVGSLRTLRGLPQNSNCVSSSSVEATSSAN